MWSSRALAVLIYGLLVHCGACSPLGYPSVRLENAGYEEGDSVADLAFDSDQIALSGPSTGEDAYTIYYPSEQRTERHADGMFNKAYRNALAQLSARKYLHSLMAKRVGGGSAMEDGTEPLSKRHSDGVFTDSYSRYRKQMAVKKYLAAVLGKSSEDLDLHQFLQDIDFGALPDGDDYEELLRNLLGQFNLDLSVSSVAPVPFSPFFSEGCLSLLSFFCEVLLPRHLSLKFHEPNSSPSSPAHNPL
ncbi:adenylate cyclase activating polypeptide 1a isoform X1 [Astyanax mexicanus]|nr:adenylate cyclase activating polypeptide 1a isoform X1 [Astyanax mexicanus]XP_015462339.1 adenylate cyclase activating polypeptide 1a isoform X1 [Astyanax mexicanus]XP_049339041.1 adenylate cyclase activating polypeptide 1a isoform X1 [Astyanax mexicanus]